MLEIKIFSIVRQETQDGQENMRWGSTRRRQKQRCPRNEIDRACHLVRSSSPIKYRQALLTIRPR